MVRMPTPRGGEVQKIGTFSAEEITALRQLINQTDFAVIRAKPFTGTCPTAFDGPELIYTFYPSQEVIASCRVAIDDQHPLFVYINGLMTKVYSQESR